MLSREVIRNKITDIIENDKPIKTGITLPIKKGEVFNVFRIPVEYLVPNPYNDRITWKIREYESSNSRKLDVENDEDINYLFNLIEEESPSRNIKTLNDIALNGQQEDIVITEDGIIIDGNRRTTLIRSLFSGKAAEKNKSVEDFRYVNAIVLPGNMDQKEIMALETMIQIGTDSKVDYNRICLYIKVDNLLSVGYSESAIQQYMGLKNTSEVKDMKETYDFMIQYLNTIGKKDHFTLLDGLEDQFLRTKSVMKKLENGTYDANWDYDDNDVSDFKMICFDYMRGKFEGKRYRDVLVGNTNKTNGVFIDKNVWLSFKENHEKIINEKNPQSEADWITLSKEGAQFDKNLSFSTERLKSTLNDKDLSKLIKSVCNNVTKIEDLMDSSDDILEDDLEALSNLAKKIYQIRKKFE